MNEKFTPKENLDADDNQMNKTNEYDDLLIKLKKIKNNITLLENNFLSS